MGRFVGLAAWPHAPAQTRHRGTAGVRYDGGSATGALGTGRLEGVAMAAKPSPRWLRPGDHVTVEIENIGSISNTVQLESLA